MMPAITMPPPLRVFSAPRTLSYTFAINPFHINLLN